MDGSHICGKRGISYGSICSRQWHQRLVGRFPFHPHAKMAFHIFTGKIWYSTDSTAQPTEISGVMMGSTWFSHGLGDQITILVFLDQRDLR